MIPRVFKGLDPSNPTYTNLAALPAGAWAQIEGKGSVQSTANRLGKIYKGAGTTGDAPSTGELMKDLTRGRGVKDIFEGVKAKKGDYPSSIAPGYVYGEEPLPMGEAASQYGTLLDAALYGAPQAMRDKYSSQTGGWGSYLIDKWASKAMKKPAGSGKPIYKYVGRRLFK
jgi:hypothetical protein